ncbi:MAG: hypothetical protein AB7N76_34860 [Planctomycetota bacterium]
MLEGLFLGSLCAGASYSLLLSLVALRLGVVAPRLARLRLPRLLRPRADALANQPLGGLGVVLVGLALTVFGGVGLIALDLLGAARPLPVLGAALLAALLTLRGLSTALVAYFPASARPREVEGGLRQGTTGHVSVAIPPAGVGAIAFVSAGKRTTRPARAQDGAALARGVPVHVVAVERSTAVVVTRSAKEAHQ